MDTQVKFVPNMQVETSDGIGVVKYTKNRAPDYREVESVCVEMDGKEAFFSPDSVKVIAGEEPAPETKRETKKAKTVKIGIAFQHADGSLLPKSEFLQLMENEYDRLSEEMGIGNYEDIAQIVNVAFDEHIGARYNLAYLHSRVMKSLQPNGVEEWKKADKRFHAFMKESVREGGPFAVRQGRNGGHYRIADHKEEAPKA